MGTEEKKTAEGSVQNIADAKKPKKRTFELTERCQDLSADVFILTANAPKELRVTICKKAQDISCEAVHAIRLANSCKLGSLDRRSAQQDTLEMLKRLGDLLPILTKCRCITPEQEERVEKKLKNILQGCDIWLTKDKERLEQIRQKKLSE